MDIIIKNGRKTPQSNGSDMPKSIDISKILELAAKGVVGNLVDSADGDKVRIFVE